jgi:LysM repeat protein
MRVSFVKQGAKPMASTIGIKVANGEFYPIMEENSPVKKRLILTTAHDNQKSIQIDLYNSYAKTMADALYVGSLVVENLKPQPKGKPSIEMILSSNSSGQITADAVDLDASVNGAHQHLSVSLTDVAEEDGVNDEIPDFDLESHEHPPRGLYDKGSARGRLERKKKFPWPLLVTAAALLLALGGLLYFFFFTGLGIGIRSGLRRPAAAAVPVPARPREQVPAPAVQPAAVPDQPVVAPPIISASQQPPKAVDAGEGRTDRTRTLPPVASYKVPQVIPRGGTPYTIRWGDTLWDISEAFYRNPWLYPRIARFNSIRNPNFIIAGRTIRIPPGN